MTNMIVTMNQTQGLCPEVGSLLGKSLGSHTHLSVPVPLWVGPGHVKPVFTGSSFSRFQIRPLCVNLMPTVPLALQAPTAMVQTCGCDSTADA